MTTMNTQETMVKVVEDFCRENKLGCIIAPESVTLFDLRKSDTKHVLLPTEVIPFIKGYDLKKTQIEIDAGSKNENNDKIKISKKN